MYNSLHYDPVLLVTKISCDSVVVYSVPSLMKIVLVSSINRRITDNGRTLDFQKLSKHTKSIAY